MQVCRHADAALGVRASGIHGGKSASARPLWPSDFGKHDSMFFLNRPCKGTAVSRRKLVRFPG